MKTTIYFRLAEKVGYDNLEDLKEEHMQMLLQTGQFEKAGLVFENDRNYEKALSMYLKANKLIRASNLLLKQSSLMNDHSLLASVLKKLLQQELYEPAAEIYLYLEKTELAKECFRKGL